MRLADIDQDSFVDLIATFNYLNTTDSTLLTQTAVFMNVAKNETIEKQDYYDPQRALNQTTTDDLDQYKLYNDIST